MNILIFGKDGQLGKAFRAVFTRKTERQNRIHYVGRVACDLANAEAIAAFLNQVKPDLIINAAAYTAVDKAETEIELAFAINAKAPEIMANYTVTHNATLLHYSTDYVFDGSKDGFYTEDDQRNPLSIYGKSKAAGEQAIEDAFVLANEILVSNDIQSGLKSYQSKRIKKATYITKTSWQFAQITNTTGLQKKLIKQILRMTPKYFFNKQLDKIYSLDI